MKTVIKLRRKFTLMDLLWFVEIFCLASYAFLEDASISISAFSMLKKPFVYATGLCLLLQANLLVRYALKQKYFWILVLLAVFCVLLGCTMLVDRRIVLESYSRSATLRLILFLAELFLFMILAAQASRTEMTLSFLYWYLLVLVVVTDAVLLTRVVTFYSGGFETYLVGSKFSVMYRHFDLAAIWMMRNQKLIRENLKTKVTACIIMVLFAVISLRVDCKTALLGCMLMLGLIVVMDSRKKNRLRLFASPTVLFAALLISAVIPFVLKEFLETPNVTYVVKDVMKRDLTLTGRTKIYAKYLATMENYWPWGYGFGTGNEVSVKMFGGYANTQNGLLQWILQVGLIGTVPLCLLLISVFWQLSNAASEKQRYLMPLVALIYVYIILGVIETTYSMGFIVLFALIFMLVNERRKQPAEGKNT